MSSSSTAAKVSPSPISPSPSSSSLGSRHHQDNHHPQHQKPSQRPSSSSASSAFSAVFRGSRKSVQSVGEIIPAIVPAFRTSAAFLSSLSANLRISDDDLVPSSQSVSPNLRPTADFTSAPFSQHPLPPATTSVPEAASTMAKGTPSKPKTKAPEAPAKTDAAVTAEEKDPLADVPELGTYVATSRNDRVDALKLVADSVAQQRQMASRLLISNPINVTAFGIFAALIAQLMYKDSGDLPLIFTTWAGITMAALVAVRWAVGPYLFQAEDINWDWLGDDSFIVTKFGDNIIGTVVLGWEEAAGKGRKKKAGGKGIIRAWTVALRYRGKGEGATLLEEAVKIVQQKGGEAVEFDENHIYSKRILPQIYNAPFDKRDKRAKAKLEEIVNRNGSFEEKK